MTYQEIRDYVSLRGPGADERYLIEAIEEHCPDPETRALIDFWYVTIDALDPPV